MASPSDKKSFNRLRVADSAGELVPQPPKLPDDVKRRFPSLEKWEKDTADYMQKQVAMSINGGPK